VTSRSDILTGEIARELTAGNLVLFVGSGLSTGAGLPDWATLVAPLAVELGQPLSRAAINGFQLLEIAADYEAEHGRNALVRKFRRALEGVGSSPTPVHMLLVKMLNPATIITTNYDNLIERAFLSDQQRCDVVTSDAGLAYWDAPTTQLIKLRGDLKQPDKLIITRHDYDVDPLRRPLVHQHLKLLFITKTILFVGYSHSDPDMDLLQHQVADQLGADMRRSYSVQFDLNEREAAKWKRRHPNIALVLLGTNRLSKTDVLRTFLRQVARQTKGFSQ
jgi:SIR2-like domain